MPVRRLKRRIRWFGEAKRGGSFRSPASWMRSARRGYLNQDYNQATGIADGGDGGAFASGYRLVIDLD